ncbi:hypothetical protein HY523_00360 [Candidatus Berkelbacteria bacterium]|nr:hypothetical protein [Candidatus Berkelbacteria bacterium]
MPDRTKLLHEIKGKLSTEEYAKLQTLVTQSFVQQPRKQLGRIPLLIPLLATFGLVATFYGFEKFLDQTILVNHPFELIGIGVVILLITGAAAQKL